ncbi:alpha/beta hydrolase [Streptosporangiaceae bacterium NEAU-GS5]|nr:alpha/beta hydrolase [Streptosporangiaceae bacterium NEAU-GS5]
MTTYVLVPGFWLGAWAWQRVTTRLRADGHTVYPLTLTGLADRAHLAGPDITLDTHTADITGLLTYEDLTDVILVAHSGAGAPATVAADRTPERIARIVYVDSGPIPDGIQPIDMTGRDLVETHLRDGWRLPWIDLDQHAANGTKLDGLTDADRALMATRATDHPVGALTQPVKLTGAVDTLPKGLISCMFPLDQITEMIRAGHPWFAGMDDPRWEIRALPTSHWPMFSEPEGLALQLAAFTK